MGSVIMLGWNMLQKTLIATAVIGISWMSAANAATVIDFDTTTGTTALGVGDVYSEDGYDFEVVSGTTFGIDEGGDPGQAFVAGLLFPLTVGDTVSITRQDGIGFSLRSLEFTSLFEGSPPSDAVDLIGYVAGVEVADYGTIQANSKDYEKITYSAFFNSIVIDELLIVGSARAASALGLDNLTFNEVPLPAAAPLFITALIGAAAYRRFRGKAQVAAA